MGRVWPVEVLSKFEQAVREKHSNTCSLNDEKIDIEPGILCAAVEVLDWKDRQIDELESALSLAVSEADSWIHDQLDGTGDLEDALAKLSSARELLETRKLLKGGN